MGVDNMCFSIQEIFIKFFKSKDLGRMATVHGERESECS